MCPICQRQGEAREPDPHRDAVTVSCQRCGSFKITRQAEIWIAQPRSLEEEQRFRLIWAARQASDLGHGLVLLQDEVNRAIESIVEPRPPVRKIDLLVRSIGDRTRSFGERIPFHPDAEWPRVFARDRAEFDQLTAAAHELGLIVFGPQ